jgi:hypothetical protein
MTAPAGLLRPPDAGHPASWSQFDLVCHADEMAVDHLPAFPAGEQEDAHDDQRQDQSVGQRGFGKAPVFLAYTGSNRLGPPNSGTQITTSVPNRTAT